MAAAAIVVLALAAAPGASAASEVGDRCVANDQEADWTTIVLNNGIEDGLQQPFVLAPPEGQSVITRWRSELEPGTGPIQQQLLAFQQVGEESDRLVGESGVETLVDGVNEFPARIPIPEYGHVGLRGPAQTLFCDKEDGHLLGRVEGGWPLGETREFDVEVGSGVPVQAFLEPDVDHDGYGDETQDGCGRLAWTQGPCPLMSIAAHRKKVRRSAIVVRVSFGSSTPLPAPGKVLVTGQAGRFELKAAPMELDPGTARDFHLRLTKAFKRKLSRLSPKRGVVVAVHAVLVNANELNGSGLQSAFAVKLRGRAKPIHSRH